MEIDSRPTDLQPIEKLPRRYQRFILGCPCVKAIMPKPRGMPGDPPSRPKSRATSATPNYTGTSVHRHFDDGTSQRICHQVEASDAGLKFTGVLGHYELCIMGLRDQETAPDTLREADSPRALLLLIGEAGWSPVQQDHRAPLAKKQPTLETLALYHSPRKRPIKSICVSVSFEVGTPPVTTLAKREARAYVETR
jgi:hypothetical protein